MRRCTVERSRARTSCEAEALAGRLARPQLERVCGQIVETTRSVGAAARSRRRPMRRLLRHQKEDGSRIGRRPSSGESLRGSAEIWGFAGGRTADERHPTPPSPGPPRLAPVGPRSGERFGLARLVRSQLIASSTARGRRSRGSRPTLRAVPTQVRHATLFGAEGRRATGTRVPAQVARCSCPAPAGPGLVAQLSGARFCKTQPHGLGQHAESSARTSVVAGQWRRAGTEALVTRARSEARNESFSVHDLRPAVAIKRRGQVFPHRHVHR